MPHSNYNNFSDSLWQNIRAAIVEEKKTAGQPVAAFDADGTLWDTDLGENFFKYEIANCPLKDLPADPWGHYRTWKENGDPRPAYLWLAQVNAGHSLKSVREWADQAVEKIKPVPIFSAQQQLIRLLIEEGVKVFIVTASVRWAVEPGARLLGLKNEDVLGVETGVSSEGIVTNQAAGHMTYREGKASALLSSTGGRPPFLAAGNTKGDSQLLGIATRIRLAVTATRPGDELYSSEHELQLEAQQKGWIQHRFR